MSRGNRLPRLSAYVINLDRSPDRLRAMSMQLDALAVRWKRVAAIDGAARGALPWADYDTRVYERSVGKGTNLGEVACYFSHLRALNMFLDDGHDFGLILEDDGVIDPNICDVLEDAMSWKNCASSARFGMW